MIPTINKKPDQKMLELGGGENPHPQSDVNVDVRPGPKTHFTVDFETFPWALSDNEWDAVYSAFCLEHITYTKTLDFLKECRRILKPGGHLILLLPNTAAQIKWLQDHPEGWDGKDAFTSMSELLFGSQDYSANAHKVFLTPEIITKLLTDAGFERVNVQPFGDRDTDMGAQAFRPAHDAPASIMPANMVHCPRCSAAVEAKPGADRLHCHLCRNEWSPTAHVGGGTLPPAGWQTKPVAALQPPSPEPVNIKDGKIFYNPAGPKLDPEPPPAAPPAELFDKAYFNGGGKVGGYSREGYRDFPAHWVTFDHIMKRRPESVLELGCARGYLVKRLQDAGIRAAGVEVSKHCYLTRACNDIFNGDASAYSMIGNTQYDLAVSVAFFEHVPEAALPGVLALLKDRTKRGLHGIDFGGKDDGFDKTHVTLRDRNFWVDLFHRHGLHTHEIVDKEELERGTVDAKYLTSDGGQVKLNLGSHMVMAHHGWQNHDIVDLSEFAAQNGYQFKRLDFSHGLPYGTGQVDLITLSHVLEHFPYTNGLALLRDCRRVLKPHTGAIRIAVPDAGLLMCMYADKAHFAQQLADLGEINDGVANAKTTAAKIWALLHEGHHACYDEETLLAAMVEAGFTAARAMFREPGFDHPGCTRIIKETVDNFPCLSLYCAGIPKV